MFLLLCDSLNLRAWFAEKSEGTFSFTWNDDMNHESCSGLFYMVQSPMVSWECQQAEEDTGILTGYLHFWGKEPYMCCTHSPQQSYLILSDADAQNI